MPPDKRSRPNLLSIFKSKTLKRRTLKRKRRPYVLMAIALLACLAIWRVTPPPFAIAEAENAITASDSTQTVEPDYQPYELPQATVHVVTLPAKTRLSVAIAPHLTTVAAFAQQENALAVINGGFFDPQNGKTTSHIVVEGNTLGDPADNERLIENSDLSPYLNQILSRSEFRAYQCRTSVQTSELQYEIAAHNVLNTPLSDSCTLRSLLGAGPQLLPDDTSFAEGFTDYANGELIRDAIGSRQPNARSAIALQPDGTVRLLMVAQRPNAPGLTLAELAEFATALGATQLLNLDGGSSSSLYYSGQTYLGRLGTDGNPVERPVKSVIIVRQ